VFFIRSIDIYIDYNYIGFWGYDKVEEYLIQYSHEAEILSAQSDPGEVILYAILGFDSDKQTLISADFMLLKMNYEQYVSLADKIRKNCRIFFKTGTYIKETGDMI